MNTRMTGRLIGAAGAAALGVVAGLTLAQARKAVAKASMALNGDWEKQMKAEHRALRKLVKEMAESGLEHASHRAALLEQVSEALTRHTLEEENIIYPALRTCGAASAVRAQLDEHADMRAMIRALEETAPEAPAWTLAAKRLKTLVDQHVQEEEQVLFPLLHDGALSGDNTRLTHLVRREGLKIS
jgi:iron-sulfur cluster repair protein YtfE (RIC family)